MAGKAQRLHRQCEGDRREELQRTLRQQRRTEIQSALGSHVRSVDTQDIHSDGQSGAGMAGHVKPQGADSGPQGDIAGRESAVFQLMPDRTLCVQNTGTVGAFPHGQRRHLYKQGGDSRLFFQQ